MKDIPIIFSGPMIRALLDGRKTMTRRLAWKMSVDPGGVIGDAAGGQMDYVEPHEVKTRSPWQAAKPGDRLWVRESFFLADHYLKVAKKFTGGSYKADETHPLALKLTGWRPSIHMPRWASRLTLIITATKIERLIRISNADAIAEGCGVNFDHPIPELTREPFPAERFRDLWIALHGPGSWDANPEVIALAFKVHAQNIDAIPKAEAA